VVSKIVGAIREFFWLERARARVSGRSHADQVAIRKWWTAAHAYLRVAAQLSPDRDFFVALTLYREGITTLTGAALIVVEGDVRGDDVADVRAAVGALDRIWPKLGIEKKDGGALEGARTILCSAASRDAGPPARDAAFTACASMRRLACALERAIEPRSASHLARRRALRLAVLAATVVVCVSIPLPRLFAPKSLALYHPVELSSVHPHSRAPSGGGGLVNGELEFTYGAHTDVQDDPWMMVDLERPTRVERIAVHNRGDGWFDDCLPLVVEVGNEVSSLEPIGTRTTVFTRTNPWVLDHIDRTIRYVRVRKRGHSYIALDEVAVYER
jgi:hypothetical protein